VVSETFERALRARKRYDPRKSKAKTWLYSIALNCARDHGRRRGAEERALERIAAGGERESLPYDAVDEREALTRAMQTLSEEEREVVALRYGADLTVPEMAKLLEQPLTTVEGRVYRGLRKLRDELG
jgi:RNA polymerase sigma-70 factor (ECF subfamily)